MPVITLKPLTQGTYDNFTLQVGSTKPSAMRDADSNYLKVGGPARESFNADQMPSDAESIDQVDIAGNNRTGADVGTYQFKNMMRYNSTNWDGALRQTGKNETWVTQTDTNVATAPDGSAWTVPIVNSTEIGTNRLDSEAGKNTFHRFINLTVTYQLSEDGFALFVSQLLPPLLLVASHGLLRLDVGRILRRCKIKPTTDEEFARILEAFRRRPIYCFAR